MTKRIKNFNRAFGQTVAALLLACGASSVSASPYSTAVQADHPVAFWRLNESSGTTALDSAGAYNGIYTNAAVGQPGYTSGSDPAALAAAFGPAVGSGADSFVGGMAVDVATNANATFSVEAWVNGPAQIPGAGIVGKGPSLGEEFYLDCGGGSQAFRFFVRNAVGTAFNASSTVTPDGNWHHLVGVCDEVNGNLYLYIDGQRKASTTVSGGIRTSSNLYMNIGSRQSAASGSYDAQFNGSISDVAVYNYALSAAQVQNHYFTAGIPPTITLQSPGNLATNEGSAVTLATAAYGTPPLSYQWLLNGNPVPGQTTATFSTNSISADFNGGLLYLVVTNAYGTVNSAGTFLSIYSGAPQITSDVQPSQLTLYPGIAFTYSVVAQGTAPLSYQWLKNGVAVAGATTSAYVAASSAGTNIYSIAVSNNFGGGSITLSGTASLVGAALPAGAFATKILSDHPIAYWRLGDATNSTVAAEYAGGHTGTYNSVQLGAPGYSPLFDTDAAAGFGSLSPTDSYLAENDNSAGGVPLIDFAKPVGSNAQFSVEAWIKGPAGQNSAGSAIVAKGNSGSDTFVLDASAPGGNFRFYTRKPGGGTSAVFSSSAPDGNWHHLVAVCDEASGSTSLYVDGINTGTVTGLGGTGLYSSPGPISIGAQNSGGGYNNQFIGTIDEVSIYNYALTSGQVLAHYNAAPVPPYFTSQPPTNVVAFLGQPITLSASVLGSAPMTNQWYSNNIALAGQTSISLAVNTSHTGTNTYTLKVSNAYGSVTNAGTVVQVPAGFGPPQLLADLSPLSTTRYANRPLTFSVTAFGSAPLAYTWWLNGTIIPGATNSTYSLANLQLTNSGSYYCLVSNSISTVTSSTSTLTVIAPPTGVYPGIVLQDHPVAYYRLDEAVGSPTGHDYVGGNDGQYTTKNANQLPLLGVPGYNTNLDSDTACQFGIGGTGSVDNYLGVTITNVSFAKPNGQSGGFSLEAWVNGNAGVSQINGGCIVAKGQGSGGEQFGMDVNNGFRFYVRNAAAVTLVNAQASPAFCGTPNLNNWQMDGKWHHLVGVCDQVNSNLLLYVDGQLLGPDVITNGVVPKLVYAYDLGVASNGTNGVIAAGAGILETTITTNNENSVVIGNRNKNSGHLEPTGAYRLPFLGKVDEVALYDYPLTPAQVNAHYLVGKGTVPLNSQRVGGQLVLTWIGGGVLQSASTVNGTYTTLVGATSPYTVTNPATQQFFRLKLN
jgi:hypothetical protein